MTVTPGITRHILATPDGHQTHYRAAGEGEPIILLHWLPSSSRQFVPVMGALAALGRRAIAPDLPGYGFSDPIDESWDFPRFGRWVGDFIGALGYESADCVGGHHAACMLTEAAIAAPEKISRLVLEGCPAWEAEKRQMIQDMVDERPPPLDDAGTPFAWTWQRMRWVLQEWLKRSEFGPDFETEARLFVAEHLLMDFVTGPTSLRDYDHLERLKLIPTDIPLMVTTAEGDSLRSEHEKVLEALPQAVEHIYPGPAPAWDPGRAEEYAGTLLGFLEQVPT